MKVTDYVYDDVNVSKPTQTKIINSDGIEHKVITRYPAEAGETNMVNKHMVAVPITTERQVAGNLVYKTTLDYSTFNSTQELPYRYYEKFYSGQTDPGLLRETMSQYDTKGNILQANREYDQPVSFIWGNYGTVLAARVQNAAQNEVAYTSFETIEVIQGGWTISNNSYIQTSPTPGARTGNGYYGTSASISKSGLGTATTKYILNYYTQNTSGVTVSGGTILNTKTSAADAQNWYYVERIIQCAANATVTVSVSGTYIDEVRLYPADALMTTYSFDRNSRLLLTMADENAIPAIFEYDPLLRLQAVRNFDKHYLQTYEYLYKNTTNPNNAVKSWMVQQSGVTTLGGVTSLSGANVKRVYSYLDGLGRPMQSIGIEQAANPNALPTPKDVVSFYEYDSYGREVKKYLPYAAPTASGTNPRTNPTSEQVTFQTPYHGSSDATYAYTEYEFDNSPLNRVFKERPPGNDFRTHPKEMIYGTNTSATEVRNFSVANGFYAINSLSKVTSKDENGNAVITYTDKVGRKIMVSNTGARTYYLYNNFGNIFAVITPEGAKQGHITTSKIYTDPTIAPRSFSYNYDWQQRLTDKTIPGTTPEIGYSYAYMYYYDQLDRPVLVKDGKGFKSFTKYDILGRPIVTGRYTGSGTPGTLGLYESKVTTGHYYTTTTAFPNANAEIYTVTYYDNYDFDDNNTDNVAYQAPPGVVSAHYPATNFAFVRGKVTGTKVGILKQDDTAPTQFLATYNFYDKWGRVIQTKADHHLSGQDITWNQYNFPGWLTRTRREHTATVSGSAKSYTINQRFTHDPTGRLLNTYHQMGDVLTDEKLISNQVYNEKDELYQKKLHNTSGSTYLQTVDYKYNIRGWLTDLNDFTTTADLFAMKLTYGNGDGTLRSNYNGGANSNWNGNITMQEWKVSGHANRHIYGYFYDTKSRIVWSYYSNRNPTTQVYDFCDCYTSGYAYDDNGNITSSTNNGFVAPSSYAWIDALAYTYSTNGQLSQIAESKDPAKGFATQATGMGGVYTSTYTYDYNGNMTADNHKKITITYNHLNLPKKVTYTATSNWIEFNYDAAGRKISKTTNTGVSKNYAGGIDYSGTNLEGIYTSEGRVTPNGASYRYEYTLKDHLGNGRVYFSDTNADNIADIIQESHQYAFGMEMDGFASSSSNDYKYNGKELNDDFGLNWYDYGARFYDPSIGRFTGVDPLASRFPSESSFSYAGNNPISNMDIGGQFKFPKHLLGEYRKAFPYFFKYIENYVQGYFLGSETIKNALLKYSTGNLTPEQIKTATKFKNGPTITIGNFKANDQQSGEYDYKTNTIKIDIDLIQQYENILKDPNASINKKLAISISLNQTLLNEFTHYGDALDGLDAIQDANGNIVNGTQREGDFQSEFDEGNEAVMSIFGVYGNSLHNGFQNLILHTRGIWVNPQMQEVGKDESKIDPKVIPPIPIAGQH